MRTSRLVRTTALAFIALAAVACGATSADGLGEAADALEKPVCDLAGILKKCTVADTSYCKQTTITPRDFVPGTGRTTIDGEGKFICTNFSGNFCRCAEQACPGSVGKTVFQQTVYCTAYQDCSIITKKHALDILCEPSPDGKTKTCHCVEPQSVFTGSANDKRFPDGPLYGSGVIGIDEVPDKLFCEGVYCNATLNKDWKHCDGAKTTSSCTNLNAEDGCPSDCCKDAKGAVAPYCLECNLGTLKLCKGVVVAPVQAQCVTCSAAGAAPSCQGAKVDEYGKSIPNGVDEPCGPLAFLADGKCPGPGTGWSDAPGPTGCNPR